MDFTCYDLSDIQEAIRRHRDPHGAAARRSSSTCAPSASILATSPWGHLAAHLADPTLSGKGHLGSRTDRMGRQAAG